MKWQSGPTVILVAIVLALAGCFGGGPDADPEAVTQAAIRSFGASLGDQDGGDIKRISGNLEMSDAGFGAMGASDGTLDMTIEWGLSEVVHVRYAMASGGMTMTLEAWCTPTQNLIKWGNDVIEGRGASTFGEADGLCSMGNDMEEMDMASGLALFDADTFDGVTIESIQTNPDGSITATLYDPEDEAHLVVQIDPQGRIVRIQMESAEGTGTFEVTYGAREPIQIPQATVRMPAQMYWHDALDAGTLNGRIESADDTPPLDEMEMRLIAHDWETDTKEVIVRFALVSGETQHDGAYTFIYHDVDSDGRISPGDTYALSHPDWADSHWIDHEVTFYDLWADGYANEQPVPALGAALLVLAIAGLAWTGRRRD